MAVLRIGKLHVMSNAALRWYPTFEGDIVILPDGGGSVTVTNGWNDDFRTRSEGVPLHTMIAVNGISATKRWFSREELNKLKAHNRRQKTHDSDDQPYRKPKRVTKKIGSAQRHKKKSR